MISYEDTTVVGASQGSFTNTSITSSLMSPFYILHRNHSHSPSLSVKEFRLHLAKELVGNYCSCRFPGRFGNRIAPLRIQHFPLKVSSYTDEETSKKKRGRCKWCAEQQKRSDSSWYCRECQVWLCHSGDPKNDCFYLWHKNR